MLLLTLALGTRSAEAARFSNSKDAVLVKVVISERIKVKFGKAYDVTVKARVLKIKRTGTGLKVGDLITIVYRQDLAREEKDRRRLEKDRENGDERIGAGAYYRAPSTMKVGEGWNLALDQTKEGTYRPDAISMDGMYEEPEKEKKFDRWRKRSISTLEARRRAPDGRTILGSLSDGFADSRLFFRGLFDYLDPLDLQFEGTVLFIVEAEPDRFELAHLEFGSVPFYAVAKHVGLKILEGNEGKRRLGMTTFPDRDRPTLTIPVRTGATFSGSPSPGKAPTQGSPSPRSRGHRSNDSRGPGSDG